MSKIVNGASLQPLSGGKPRQIVVLLHGYGSSGSDMIALAPEWRQRLPDALFLAPHAPQTLGAGAYQWWPLGALSPQALAAGAASAAPAVDEFIDRKRDQYGLRDADILLVGFSQGTMMALHVGLRRPSQVAGIVGYSGMLTGGPELAGQVVSKPPVLLVHGSADQVVPVTALHSAEQTLRQLGAEVATHVCPGLGHSVDPAGLRLGAEFAAEVLGQVD